MILPGISLAEKRKDVEAFPIYLCSRQINSVDTFGFAEILTSGILRTNVVTHVSIRGEVPMTAVEYRPLLSILKRGELGRKSFRADDK